MKSIGLALASLLAAALPAQANLIYAFSYTAERGPIQSFSFSMLSPTFISPGTPAFSPFTITDGSAVFAIQQDSVAISTGQFLGSQLIAPGDGCFSFGSSGSVLSPCSWALPNTPGLSMAAFTVTVPGGPPSQTGTFSDLVFDGDTLLQPTLAEEPFYDCCGIQRTGTFQLTITQVPTQIPEPSGMALLVAGISIIGTLSVVRRRKAAGSGLAIAT